MYISKITGNSDLWYQHKTLFLASKHAPYSLYGCIFDWVERLTNQDCVVCFNTSELEQEVLQALLVAHIRTILIVTHSWTNNGFNKQISIAIRENRMAIIELQRDEPRGFGNTIQLRNRFAIENAEKIICGYISPHGSIISLLYGHNNIVYLQNSSPSMVAEREEIARWTLEEDKQLLHLFYADKGIHAIHCATGHTYSSIRTRMHSICMSNELLMGREFENYIIEQLFAQNNEQLELLEWRSDKSLGNIFPIGNSLPDLLIRHNNRIISVECKWRNQLTQNNVTDLFSAERLTKFAHYASDINAPIFLILGIGGLPSTPTTLYLTTLVNKKSTLQPPNINLLRKSKVAPKKLLEHLLNLYD